MAKAEFAAAADPFLPQQQPQYIYGVPVVEDQPQPYLLLPIYPGGGGNRLLRRRRRRCCTCLSSLLSSSSLLALLTTLILLSAATFFLFPSDPELRVVRLRLDSIHLSPVRHGSLVSLNVAIGLGIRVRNSDFYSLDYNSVRVSIGYRGRRLGSVVGAGGHVRARGVSYVDAELRLDGIRVLEDAFYLIEDIARGSIPFDTITEVQGGVLHFLSFDVPIEGKISCAIRVNPENQTILHQDCYPE